MQINITQTTEEAQRMFNATVCDGERFLDTVAADTYIQLVLTAAMASGAIHWHIEWEPITDDGFIESV